MSDYTLAPCSTLVCGMTGSGKTTFGIRYLLNVNAACRFVFDDLGQAAARLRRPHASTAHELDVAVRSQWVIFNPHRMFPADGEYEDARGRQISALDAAFQFFCKWCFDVSRTGPGKKVVMIDEVWRFCSSHGIPKELAMLCQAGRAENIELVSLTQMPHRLNDSLCECATELVCFRLNGPLALDKVESLGADRRIVENLPLGSFQSWNCQRPGTLSGKLF